MHFVQAHNPRSPVRLREEPLLANDAEVLNCHLGRYTEIGSRSSLTETEMDDYSYCCEQCQIIYSKIGKFVNIASSVRINPGFHPIERPSLHHFTYRPARFGFAGQDDEEFFQWRRVQQVSIGHDVWLGHGCVVMPGVSIGNGAVVGSCAVVTRDVPAYSIVAGVPARVLRHRFNRQIAARLEATRWWDWSHEELGERLVHFKDIHFFLARYGRESHVRGDGNGR